MRSPTYDDVAVLIRVDERLAITRRQGPVLELAVIGADLRHVHLLKIAAAARCAGKSEMDEIDPPKYLVTRSPESVPPSFPSTQ